MKREVKVVIAEDDEGHAALIKKNLKRAGVMNDILHFRDGQDTLDFLLHQNVHHDWTETTPLLLLLDIKMPRLDGIELLRQIKASSKLRRIPVIMITTTDDPREVEICHDLGCSHYITKPVVYEKFVAAIRQLGLFLLVVEVPLVKENN